MHIGLRCLRVYWYCPFSCATEDETTAAILILSFYSINVVHLILIKLFHHDISEKSSRGDRVRLHGPHVMARNTINACASNFLSSFFLVLIIVNLGGVGTHGCNNRLYCCSCSTSQDVTMGI